MTITVTENQAYAGVVLLLIILQVIQQYQLSRVRKEVKQVWDQLAMMLFTLSTKLPNLNKEEESK